MSTIINATTTNGVVIQPDNSGSLQLATNNGTTAVTIDTSQNVGIGTTSPSSPLSFANSTGQKITLFTNYALGVESSEFRLATNGIFAFRTGGYTGTERMRIDSSGNVQIATTSQSNSAVLTVAGTVSASLNGRIYSLGTYNNTTASGANMHIASDGHMFRSTSSIKYKTDIQDTTHGLDKVMELRSVTYKGINDGEIIFGGLIAEEVHEAGLTEFVQYAEDGSPDALAYGQMVSLAFKAIQEQQTIINDLKARVEILEAKLG